MRPETDQQPKLRARRPPRMKPQPSGRLGPRPLPAHLMMAATLWGSSKLALPLLKNGLLPWRPELGDQGEELLRALDGVGLDEFAPALDAELRLRAGQLIDGLEKYRAHPYRRTVLEPPAIWQEGTTRLLDYGPPDGLPVLVIPSLINRGYILDLDEQRSFMRYMARCGLRPLLLDWGRPGDTERGFDLTDYIAGRLDLVFEAVVTLVRQPVALMGYCMGGLLALALAERRQRDVAGLVLMATPWDFHAADPRLGRVVDALSGVISSSFEPSGEVPTDILQMLFFMIDPQMGIRKFTRFATLDGEGDAARVFVATEDWLNDGVPLALPTARDCFSGWYGRNEPATKQWRIAGRVVDPARVTRPALLVIPTQDRLVPAASSRPLAKVLPRITVIERAMGHIGIVVGSRAQEQVWRPVCDEILLWMKS